MKFESLMHIAFICKDFEAMKDFYENKLGLKKQIEVRYKEYLNRNDRPEKQRKAIQDPDGVFYVYYEITSGQYLELFPYDTSIEVFDNSKKRTGFHHLSLLVNDIHSVYKEMQTKGIKIKGEPSKGPSGTWQFYAYDPDGNAIEVMQFTDSSYQVVGHITE